MLARPVRSMAIAVDDGQGLLGVGARLDDAGAGHHQFLQGLIRFGFLGEAQAQQSKLRSDQRASRLNVSCVYLPSCLIADPLPTATCPHMYASAAEKESRVWCLARPTKGRMRRVEGVHVGSGQRPVTASSLIEAPSDRC